jgi:hypothetical protein
VHVGQLVSIRQAATTTSTLNPEQQHVGVELVVERRAHQRPAHADQAEHHPDPHPHTPGAQVRRHADQRGDAHEEEARGGGVLGVLAGGVHQHGHGQDRPAATEGAQRQPDEEPER